MDLDIRHGNRAQAITQRVAGEKERGRVHHHAVCAGIRRLVEPVDRRGLNSLEIKVNGWSWLTIPGVFNRTQPYAIDLPDEIPPGVMDLEAIACGDTGVCSTATLTVTEGAACASEATCLPGQRCGDGRCLWDPPSREIGEACEVAQQCLSLQCEDVGGALTCTEECQGGPNDRCPDGFVCGAAVGESGAVEAPPPGATSRAFHRSASSDLRERRERRGDKEFCSRLR